MVFKNKFYFVYVVSIFLLFNPQNLIAAWQYSGGMQVINFDYQEDLILPKKSHENGTNVYFAYDVKGDIGVDFVQINGDFTFFGTSQYDGSTLSNSTVVPVTATDEHIFHRHEANYFFKINDSFFLTAGLGYRYWKRFLSYGTGYTEHYSWFYTPLGIYIGLTDPRDLTKLNYGLEMSLRPTFGGKILVQFSDRIANGQDTTLNLGARTGYRIKAPVSIPFNDYHLHLSVAPWFEFSQIGESNSAYNSTPGIEGNIVEPASVTQQLGVELLVKFLF